MITAELDAAGVTDQRLRAAYRRCRELNARHGQTYYLATRMLAPGPAPGRARAVRLRPAGRRRGGRRAAPARRRPGRRAPGPAPPLHLSTELASGQSPDPVLAAVADTARRYAIPPGLFADFMDSMRMDLTVTSYPDRAALDRYVHGSAEVIGLQVLPVLGTAGPQAEAAPYAAALGKAFQLTNFLRDVAEDLDLGRVYLPADELAAFGVTATCSCGAARTSGPTACRRAWPTSTPPPGPSTGTPTPASPCSTRVPALRGHRPHAVLRDPGPDRGPRLRGLRPAGPRREGPAAAVAVPALSARRARRGQASPRPPHADVRPVHADRGTS